jgi:hypothetical protein
MEVGHKFIWDILHCITWWGSWGDLGRSLGKSLDRVVYGSLLGRNLDEILSKSD